jgi:glycosyltransferase involved in cell wall biosynthesis
LKIVHIITRLIIGGAQENTLLSCEGQHRLGHDVTLLTGPPLGPEGSLLDRARSFGYRVEIIDEMKRSILPGQDFRTYRSLVRHLRALQPDIVHTHSSKAGIIGRFAAHQAGVPGIVHTIHGLSFTSSRYAIINRFYRFLERQTAPLTHRIVCVATAMSRESLRFGIGRPEQYTTVFSGMEINPFLSPRVPRPSMREQLGLLPDDIAVATVARLFHLKGHDDLISLAPDLCKANPRLRFVWIGDGILRAEFERQIARLNLSDRFVFAGLVAPERVPELISACDILAHPSRREGLARAIPQGQLCGCPVVCYDIDGNAEGLIEGETGFAIRAFDVPAFGRAIQTLASDEAMRKRFGHKGRTFAADRFSAERMVESLEVVYRDALCESQTRGRVR